jgi:hypothetical protein
MVGDKITRWGKSQVAGQHSDMEARAVLANIKHNAGTMRKLGSSAMTPREVADAIVAEARKESRHPVTLADAFRQRVVRKEY